MEDLDQMITCPTCDAEQAWEEALLGGLCRLVHFRCRCCGAQWSESIRDHQYELCDIPDDQLELPL